MTDRPLDDRRLATRIEEEAPTEAANPRSHAAQKGEYRNFRKIPRRVPPNGSLLDERAEVCRLSGAPANAAADGSKGLRDARGHA